MLSPVTSVSLIGAASGGQCRLMSPLLVALVTIIHGAIGVSGHTSVHHIHHGVERADHWDDVWLVHLTDDTQPQVSETKIIVALLPTQNIFNILFR